MGLVAFYLDSMKIPDFWFKTNPKAAVINNDKIFETPQQKHNVYKEYDDGTFIGGGVIKQIKYKIKKKGGEIEKW